MFFGRVKGVRGMMLGAGGASVGSCRVRIRCTWKTSMCLKGVRSMKSDTSWVMIGCCLASVG